MRFPVQMLPVSDLDYGGRTRGPDYRFQHDHLKEGMLEVLESVREHGVINPLIVVRKDRRLSVVVGNQRLWACREIGMETVPCIVLDSMDDDIREAHLTYQDVGKWQIR